MEARARRRLRRIRCHVEQSSAPAACPRVGVGGVATSTLHPSRSVELGADGLTPAHVRRYLDDGFLAIRNLLPRAGLQPLIDEMQQKVDVAARAAVSPGRPGPRHGDHGSESSAPASR